MSDKLVRLQIPLHEDVAAKLDVLAKGFERPTSWMAREVLLHATESEEFFAKWFVFKTIGKSFGNKRDKLISRNLPDFTDGPIVRIQVNVPESLVKKIEVLAKKHYRSVTKMSSLLIVRCLDEEGWIIKFATCRFAELTKRVSGE